MWFSLILGAALAQQSVTVEVLHTVYEPKVPALILSPQIYANNLKVELDCGGTKVHHEGSAEAGTAIRIPIHVAPGAHACTGSLLGWFSDGSQGEMPLHFQVAVQRPVTLRATADDIDLEAGSLHVSIDQPADQLVLRVYGESGRKTAETVLQTVKSSPVLLNWTPTKEKVIRLAIEATMSSGLRGTLDLFPWSYQIPHQDVIFPTGSSAIPHSEAPKLEEVMRNINAVLRRFNHTTLGFEVPMSLYVAGFTDTVGNRIQNQRLSEARAEALGMWFRTHGFTGSIHYQGLGENGQAIATGDDVDQPANRRAMYFIAADTPRQSTLLPASNWQPLR